MREPAPSLSSGPPRKRIELRAPEDALQDVTGPLAISATPRTWTRAEVFFSPVSPLAFAMVCDSVAERDGPAVDKTFADQAAQERAGIVRRDLDRGVEGGLRDGVVHGPKS